MSEDKLEMDFFEDDDQEVQEEQESQEDVEQVTEDVEDDTPETEPAKPHDPDKGLQKLQQELGNIKRDLEREREERARELAELRKPRSEPEPTPEPTEVDRLLSADDDDVDPYKATKTLASELQAIKKQLAEERASREQLSSGIQQSEAERQRQAAEQNFRQTYPEYDGDFNAVQTKAFEYLNQQYPDVRDWSQMPASVFNRHATEAVQHVVGVPKPAEPATEPEKLSEKPPKSTAGTKINTGKSAKKEAAGLTVDQMVSDAGFFFED